MRIPRTSLLIVLFGVACSASNGTDDDEPLSRRILKPISEWPFPGSDASLDDSDGEPNESAGSGADAGSAPPIAVPSDEEDAAAEPGSTDGGTVSFPTDDAGCVDAGEDDGDAEQPDAGCAESD